MSPRNRHEKIIRIQKKVTTVGAPDAKIVFTKAPFIQYEQILLEKTFRQYLETITVSKTILRMEVQKTLIQKTYEIAVGSDLINTVFLSSNRQLDWLEKSLVFDKRDKHTTIYNSYNAELAAKYIKSVKLTNFTEIYSVTNEKNMTWTISPKNICYTNNLSPGPAMVAVLHH